MNPFGMQCEPKSFEISPSTRKRPKRRELSTRGGAPSRRVWSCESGLALSPLNSRLPSGRHTPDEDERKAQI
ncbi:Hypothetical protein NTJ_10802 [Nesidiocoris tenuis]|uniref:Uncharacterized protein n=1 Tax=Nesidiocoris tenuis TaxID=355587 RepID=A0ABN7B5F2_9HEMI|nr:Hypothetical protein NTJ_10802 [Nesidiocoris tenuis]